MSAAKNLEKASGLFFFGGFLLSKFQYIAFPLLSAIFRFVSLGMSMLAYFLLFVSNLLHPDQKVRDDKWYGFAQIKEQFLFSSFAGLVATTLSVAAVFIPVLIPISSWIFLIGNVFGSIGEYHKLNNPPINDSQFSKTRQQSHLSFTIILSVISLVSAIAATVIFLFPSIAFSATIFSVLLCVGLGISAFEFWLDSNFGAHKPTPIPGSYHQMSRTLLQSCTPIPENSPEPNFNNGFSWSQKKSDEFVTIKRNDLIHQDDSINQNVNNQDHGFHFNSSL